MGGGNIYNLPSGYTQLNYISCNGGQYIDTGIEAVYPLSIEYEVQTAADVSSADWILAGCATSSTQADIIGYLYQGKWIYRAGSVSNFSTSSIDAIGSTKYFGSENRVSSNSVTMTINGKSETSTGESTIGTGTLKNIYLGAYNNYTGITHYWQGDIYIFNIYQEDTCVRRFIPCLNDENIPGFWECINGQFYPSISGLTFGYNKEAN